MRQANGTHGSKRQTESAAGRVTGHLHLHVRAHAFRHGLGCRPQTAGAPPRCGAPAMSIPSEGWPPSARRTPLPPPAWSTLQGQVLCQPARSPMIPSSQLVCVTFLQGDEGRARQTPTHCDGERSRSAYSKSCYMASKVNLALWAGLCTQSVHNNWRAICRQVRPRDVR